MAQFEPAFQFLMDDEDRHRSGKVTLDDGGVTRWGISSHAYPDVDIKNLSLEDAALIYRRDYFTPLRGFEIADQNVANKLLDLAVNMEIGAHGPAVKIFQQACCDAGRPVVCDGAFGSLTLQAINLCDPTTLLDRARARAADHYRAIVAAKPEDHVYLDDWLKRAAK